MTWKDNLEQTFVTWSKPASDTEETRCDNALRMIREAIKAHDELKNMQIEFVPKGSYHNNTNVRLNSDVDICVNLTSLIFAEYPNGMSASDFGIVDSGYHYSTFKKSVREALVNKFGEEGVSDGNKSIQLNSNSYRVNADVVPSFEHRRYERDGSYVTGTQYFALNGEKVVNFPKQHYENGVNKNNQTSRKYKRVVRILKRAKGKMKDDGYSGLENISSFLIECLVWNAPNNLFNDYSTYTDIVKSVLSHLYHNTKENETCKEWGEVSDLFYLFHGGRKYTRQEVNSFLYNMYLYLFA